MRRTVVTLLLGGLLLAAGVLMAPPASACSCVGGTTQEFFDRADAVFTARLVSREGPQGLITSSADPALHVFAVDTVFKGSAAEQQGVLSPDSGASCGLELSGEGPFVVFATRSTDLGSGQFATLADDQYAATLCGGTAPVTPPLAAELATLARSTPAPPAAPSPGAAGVQRDDRGLLLPGLAAAAAAVLVTAGALRYRRRARGD